MIIRYILINFLLLLINIGLAALNFYLYVKNSAGWLSLGGGIFCCCGAVFTLGVTADIIWKNKR